MISIWIFFKLYTTDLFCTMKIKVKFDIEIEVKSRGYLITSPPLIIKCLDDWIRGYTKMLGMQFFLNSGLLVIYGL